MTWTVLSVSVPATSANLGPGFDCLGMALNLFNTFRLTIGQPFAIRVTGVAAEQLPRDRQNVVVQAIERVLQEGGLKHSEIPEFALDMDNHVPVSSGLGSSAAALVGGLLLGNQLRKELGCQPLAPDRILEIATEMEGHPDNVAPALLGGGVLAFQDRAGTLRTTQFPIPPDLRFVAATPNFALSTEEARRVLPSKYPRHDVIYNVSQSMRLMLALAQNDLDLLRGGIYDRLHEPYRKVLIPGADDVIDAAVKTGAFTVTLSGAGPSYLAWCTKDKALQIADEMTLAWENAGIPCQALVLRPVHEVTTVHVSKG